LNTAGGREAILADLERDKRCSHLRASQVSPCT
jgi:hypothetical protein